MGKRVKKVSKKDKREREEKKSTTKLRSNIKRAFNKSQKVFGVEFAPLSVPWERRKQTLAVLTWIMLFFVTGPGGPPVLLFLFFCTRLWFLPIAYLSWIVYDRDTCNKGSRKSTWVRNWILWKEYRNYFPINLVKTAELDPSRNYLLTSHPHGILSSGAFCSFGTEGIRVSSIFPGISMHILTLPLNFYLPFYREFCLSLGLCSAKKESMNYLLSHPDGGKGAVLIPGGAHESLDSHPGYNVVQLKNRKGFIKVALQNGSPLVPIYCFGETDIFDQVANPEGSILRKFQVKVMNVLSFAPALFTGRGIFQYSFGVLPRRHPIHVVVGSPIEVQKSPNPSQEEIDTLHATYIEELTKIFNKYKGQFSDDPKAELQIV